MPKFARDGVTISYDDEGGDESRALLLVHGHPFNRSMWRPQVDYFSQRGWRVIAPDLRGYGESTVVPGATSMATFARDLNGLLEHLDIERAVVGGLSMGGQVAMEFCRLFPQRTGALMLADTSATSETDAGKQQRRSTAERLERQGMTQYADEALPKMISPHTMRHLPEVSERVLAMMRASPPDGAAAALRGRAERVDYTEMLRHIRIPTLVVVGTQDAFTPLADAQLIHSAVPNATLAVIDAAGHMPNLERPEEFNAALEGLLNSIPAGAPQELSR